MAAKKTTKKTTRKKSKGLDTKKLIISLIVIALSVVTICTLFMPMFATETLVTNIITRVKGVDVFAGAFAGEATSEMSEGALLLYSLKTGEETGFVTNVFMWSYMITLLVSVVTLAFAVLSLLGIKIKNANLIIGAVLVILALVTFIFAIIVASKNTSITEVFGNKTGIQGFITIGSYLLLGTLACGGAHAYSEKA